MRNFAKQDVSSGVARKEIPNNRIYLNSGYIGIPSGVDRDTFVTNAFRRERVSLYIENGASIKNDCLILRSALKDIEFPDEYGELGSAVAFIQEPYTGQAVVLGVLPKNDETSLREEHQIGDTKTWQDKFVSIKGDAKKGIIGINVEGGDDISKIDINVTNKNKNAEFNVNVKGKVNINVEGNANVKATENVNLTAKNGIFSVNEGSEPILLGDETQKNLDKEKDYVSSLVSAISAAFGVVDTTAGSASKASFDAATATLEQGDFSEIKSKKSFTD